VSATANPATLNKAPGKLSGMCKLTKDFDSLGAAAFSKESQIAQIEYTAPVNQVKLWNSNTSN